MSIVVFAAQIRDGIPRLRVRAAAFVLLSCFVGRAQAAQFTVGGSISNLVGNGLVLRLDTQAGCITAGNIASVTNSPAAGGTAGCQTTATDQCCSLSSYNFH